MLRTTRVTSILLLVAVAALTAGAGWLLGRGPAPPAPADLSNLDPALADLIAETRADIRADPTDPAAWARLGMVYEANGFVGLAVTCYEQSVASSSWWKSRVAPRLAMRPAGKARQPSVSGIREGGATQPGGMQRQPNAAGLPPRTATLGTEARWWYRLALVRARAGNVEGALMAARRASELDERYAPAHWRQGLWRLDRGELDAAEHAFRRALAIDLADPVSSAGLARVDLARRRPERAAETLEALLAARPGDRYAFQLLGRAYSQMGRRDEAAFALAVGVDGEPTWRDPWSDELAPYRRGYATLLKDAVAHFQNGRFDEAIAIYQRLRQQRRENPALVTQLGAAYVAAGRIDEALSLLEPVVAANPDLFDAYVTLASAYLRKGNAERALAHADRALALNPAYARAHEARGMVLWRTERHDGALSEFQAAYRADPRNVMALVWMGMVHADRKRYDEALACFEQASVKSPMLVDAWLGIARAHVELGSHKQAAAALARAERIDAAHPQVRAGWFRLEELARAKPQRQ